MKFLQLIAFGTLVALSLETSSGHAAEMRLAVAPRIALPPELPVYSEELSNFYGTAASVLMSPGLRALAETQLGHKVPDSLTVDAMQIPRTSEFTVAVTGVDEPTAKAFLSALVDQFFKSRLEHKKKAYADAIASANAAISSAPKELVPRLTAYRDNLVMASLLDNKDYLEVSEY